MAESFADLFEQSIASTKMQQGSIVKAVVVSIDENYVTVNAGLKSEGIISVDEFYNDNRELEVNLGDEVDVILENIEDGFGETILSREKAKRFEAWCELEKAHKANETVRGMICDKVKGGFTVGINNVRAFLPGSLVDIRPIRDMSQFEGIELEFKVIKMDQKRNNIVVSRRAVLQEESSSERQVLLENLSEGQEIKGIVKNLTDYGAFIDLGGVDGLLHITDISWKRVKHPSEILNVGDEIVVKILRFDRERNRVSLGMKQLGEDPWVDITRRYPVDTRLFGKVTNITDYGCFVEIEEGVEGLVHMSEMDWTNKNIHPSKVVQLGDEVEVMVLEIDEERRRISLGMKQCISNPWQAFAEIHKRGDKVSGSIRSITDFGIFIGLDGSIDGLVHLSDISWTLSGEEAVHNYKKGQEVEAIILAIDPERERISLGVKQLEEDAFGSYVSENSKGSIVKAKVVEVSEGEVTLELVPEVTATMRASDITNKERITDARMALKVDEEVEVKLTTVDKKNRVIKVSIKAKESDEEKEAVEKFKSTGEGSGAKLGDLMKEQIDSQSEGTPPADDDEKTTE